MCGHVKTNGDICWGSWYEPLIKSLGSTNLEELVEVLTRFIKNPELSDPWGADAGYFPEYKEEGEVKPEVVVEPEAEAVEV